MARVIKMLKGDYRGKQLVEQDDAHAQALIDEGLAEDPNGTYGTKEVRAEEKPKKRRGRPRKADVEAAAEETPPNDD